MQDDLRSLIQRWPLPPGYSEPQLFADEIEIGDAIVRRAGLQSTAPTGEELVGSAAVLDGSPVERAYFELLERVALIDATNRSCSIRDIAGCVLGALAPSPAATDQRRRAARSNGVALHRSWAEACQRARCELVERDRILGAWYGELALVSELSPSCVDAFRSTHDWIAMTVAPASSDVADADVEVALVFGFPRTTGIPLARGFACRSSSEDAVSAAAMEAIQSLAFVWGEPVPVSPPELSPTPLFHLDYYLWPGNHQLLRDWLESSAVVPARSLGGWDEQTRYVDLTPPTFGDALRVSRAVRNSARELIFGEPPAHVLSALPPARHVHPIS